MGTRSEPFAVEVEDGRSILRSHGSKRQPVVIEVGDIPKILDAIVDGWDIDIKYRFVFAFDQVFQNQWTNYTADMAYL